MDSYIYKKGNDLLFSLSVIENGVGVLNLDANTLTVAIFSNGKSMYWGGTDFDSGSPVANSLSEASQANFPGFYSYTMTNGWTNLDGTIGLFQINPISSGQADPSHDFDWGELTMISYDAIFEIQQSMTDGPGKLKTQSDNIDKIKRLVTATL